ncbi:pseudouridine synthase [Shewanella cyperi]|uniref:Pseudouridine synthase n=1 Tax=Shewanella cyperi TaxID=2814292 RepID=A0A974XP82_9GAMM|nr:16S rRNA pseudouridine(516) synthase [Shewanella cyperi]QSX30716.1 pseudouridine synthase [Shewanella cyperi]
MRGKRGRLDRLLAVHLQIPRKSVRALLAEGRISLNGDTVSAPDLQLDEFCKLALDGELLLGWDPVYLMLHKPAGIISATSDAEQATLMQLLPDALHPGLHIVGRLDKHSSGLVLLTNDSRWSESLMQPDAHVPKLYRVTLANPIAPEAVQAFAEGMYFDFEDIITRPARLVIEAPRVALVELTEGRYHQIKRMFGRFRNPVVALHRLKVGNISLDASLAPGQWRHLSAEEVADARKIVE